MSSARTVWWRGAVLGLTVLAAVVGGGGAADWLDRRLGDVALSLVPVRGTPEPVVIVAIDDASLAQFGRWPWPRPLQARLIDALGGARALGYNVALTEPAADPADDRVLEVSLRRHGRVVLPLLVARTPWGKIELPPLPGFVEAAAAVGHSLLRLEADGAVRGVLLWGGIDPPPFPAFALALHHEAAGTQPPAARGMAPNGQVWRGQDERLVPFARLRPEVVSAADVLAGRADPGQWRGRVVIAGVTAEGVADHWTVASAHRFQHLSGSDLQARIVQALALEPAFRRASRTGAAVGSAVMTATVGAALLGSMRTRHLVLLAATLPLAVAAALLTTLGLWLPPAAALLAGGLMVGVRLSQLWRDRLRQLQLEQRRAGTILDAIDDAVLTLDGAGRIRFANRAAALLIGRPKEALLGEPVTALLPAEEQGRSAERKVFWPPEAPRAPASLVRLTRPEGDQRFAQASRYQLATTDHPNGEELVVLTDVTELTSLHRQLEEAAVRDVVTDLPNRQFVHQHLPQALARAARDGTDLAVLLIDLDHFKEVNDRFGHPTGDRLLRAVGERLRTCCRRDDLVARLGGDEFVIAMAGLRERHHAALLADKILRAFREPIDVGERRLVVEPSIGISCASDQPGDADALLGRADLAMYQAKHRRGAFRLFSPELDRAARDELQLRQELRDALANRSFLLHYQPRVALADWRITGCEALLRWQRPGGGMVPPDRFIPIAENAGLLEPITEWVLDTALASWRHWRALQSRPLAIAVNVSARHFLQPEFLDFVRRRVSDAALPPGTLVVEITETMLMQDPSRAATAIAELQRVGVGVSIDDFGTGYSSLAYLRDFPIDEIKIDKSFAARLGGEARDDLLVKAITAMAQSLQLGVVAEGVERPDQQRFLADIGVLEAQGYLFSPPVPAPRIEAMLRAGGRLPMA